jgi:hypothetical protein
MEFKICSKCKAELPATVEFFRKARGQCKDCERKWRRKYRQTNRAKELERVANRRYKNSEKGKAAIRKYDQSDKGRKTQKRWRESEAGKVANKKYRQTEKGRISKRTNQERYRQTERGKAVFAKAYKKYKQTEYGREAVRKVNRKHYKNNRLSSCISRRIRTSLKSDKAGCHWEDLVDYTLDELKDHIENLFQPGMFWDNYGRYGWHIDHKIPVSLFNIDSYDCKDFKKCWALENLQPLWARDNLKKGNKVNYRGGYYGI